MKRLTAVSTSTLGRVPDEVLELVFRYGLAKDAGSWALVSKRWRGIIKQSRYWLRITKCLGVVAVGGWDGETELTTCEVYNPLKDEWKAGPRMPVPRSHVGCCIVDRKLYVVGGRDAETRMSTCEVYDPVEMMWEQLPAMSRARSSLALQAVNRTLFAFGGYDGHSEHAANEALDISAKTWSPITRLPKPCSQMASTTLDDSIYLAGGCRSSGEVVTSEACRYCVVRDCFTVLPNMQQCRLSAAATVLNGMVYVLGGSSALTTHQTVECYDPRANIWTRAANLSRNCVNLAAATFSDTILVVGGYHAQLTQLANVERFFPSTHPSYTSVRPPEAPSTGYGAWIRCRELRQSREAVSVCIFE